LEQLHEHRWGIATFIKHYVADSGGAIKQVIVVEMSAERRDNGLGLGGVITAHGGEDGTVMID
jgi:hypothetical protein